MVQKELPQAWWFDSHSLSRQSPWLTNTLSELEGKTKQMLKLIDQDADSFAQRAEMYYKKRPVLVDMLGDLYRAHRSLAEQYDLLKSGSGTRQTTFGPSSCTQSWSQVTMSGKKSGRSSFSLSSDSYDSEESEVDDPEPEHEEESESKLEDQPEQIELMRTEINSLKEQNAEVEDLIEQNAALKAELAMKDEEKREVIRQIELMSTEISSLKEQNTELQKLIEQNAALKGELAVKNEEKREVIRQLASSIDIMKEENATLRECIRSSKHSFSSSSSRAFDFKKLTKDLFSAKLFSGYCKTTTTMVAL